MRPSLYSSLAECPFSLCNNFAFLSAVALGSAMQLPAQTTRLLRVQLVRERAFSTYIETIFLHTDIMSFKVRLLLAFLALGMGAAVLSRGSSLPVLKTPSTSVGFVSAPGVSLRRHGQFNLLVGPRRNGVQYRGLSSWPVRRALCLAAVAAWDGCDINAGDKVAKAKKRLAKAEGELDAAQEADPVDDQRVAKAELGVAKAEVGVAKAELKAAPESEKAKAEIGVAKAEIGVAEAELGVAKAEVGVAKAELKAAPESEKAKAEIGVAKAEFGVAKAELKAAPESEKAVFLGSLETAHESIKTANMAYQKVLNALTATLQRGEATSSVDACGGHPVWLVWFASWLCVFVVSGPRMLQQDSLFAYTYERVCWFDRRCN